MKTKRENNLPPVTSSSNFALGYQKGYIRSEPCKGARHEKTKFPWTKRGRWALVPKNMPQEEEEEGTDNTTKVESVQTLKTTVNYEGNHNDPLRHEMAMPTTEEVITPLSQEETEIGVVTMENSAPVTNENLADTSLRKRTPQNPYKTTSSIRASGTSINHHQTSGESPSRDWLRVSFSTQTEICLKDRQKRAFIHRCSLKIKTKKTDCELLIQKQLQLFFTLVLQSSIIPPYLAGDRQAREIQDLSAKYNPAQVKGVASIKKYFRRLFPRAEGGQFHCNMILAMMKAPAIVQVSMAVHLRDNRRGYGDNPLMLSKSPK